MSRTEREDLIRRYEARNGKMTTGLDLEHNYLEAEGVEIEEFWYRTPTGWVDHFFRVLTPDGIEALKCPTGTFGDRYPMVIR